MITVTNTVSGKKELLKPIKKNKVLLYVCGVTPYDSAHVGHGRCYVSFDLLYRVLSFIGFDVTYCRNFTDIDDKLIKKAKEQFGDGQQYGKIAEQYIAEYIADMSALNCVQPTHEPKVTEHIPEIIQFIEGLIEKGYAYVVGGNVYFSIAKFEQYGVLANHKLEDLRAGFRVQVDERKKDPLDFALWKSEKENTFWQSPWGYGRPGWHIECSALAKKYLGEQIDIHCGGRDLIFPHHENEIAQTESFTGKRFANYWLHNGLVRINKEKMSKSLGNFFTLKDVFKQFDPMVIRFYFLSHYYRAPLEFSFDDIKGFEKSYRKLTKVFADTKAQAEQKEIVQSEIVQKMLTFLLDDLNTSGMLGVLFENLGIMQNNKQERAAVKAFIQQVLGLSLALLPEKQVEITPEVQQLIDERKKARATKDWARADKLRDQLQELGINVQDKKL